MKRTALTLFMTLAGLAAVPMAARADDAAAPAAAASAPADAASPIAYNVGLVSDYRYRGISQSRDQPALQGGVDYTSSFGLYLGTWLSTIKWIKDAGPAAGVNTGSTPAEWDLYGGYRGDIIKDTLTYDVGGLYYLYVSNKYNQVGANADTFEIYGALTYGPATLKYSHALTNLFGFVDSKNSGYLDLSANFDLGSGFSLTPHIGHQEIKHTTGAPVNYSYTDYSLTLGKDFGNGLSVSAAAVGTDDKKLANGLAAFSYTSDPAGDGYKSLQKATLVVGVKYTF